MIEYEKELSYDTESRLEKLTKGINDLLSLNLSEQEDTADIEDEVADDIDINTDFKHIVLKREDIVRAINLANKVSFPKSDSMVCNSLSFICYADTISIFATNELSQLYLDYDNLGNKDNYISDIFSIPYVILQKIAKLMGKRVLFYIKESNLYTRLLDGDLLLDLRIPLKAQLGLPINETKKLLNRIPLSTIGRVVSSISPILNSELRVDARRISIDEGKATFISSYYYIESKLDIPNMCIRAKDAEFLSKVYKYYQDSFVEIYEVDSSINRTLLKIDNITYLFISRNASKSNLVNQQIEKLMKPAQSIVDFNRLSKIVYIASMLPSSIGDLKLKYSGDKLICSIITNKGESPFSLYIDRIEDGELYKEEVVIKAEILKRLLVSFSDSSKVGVTLTEYGVIIDKANVRAILMHNI